MKVNWVSTTAKDAAWSESRSQTAFGPDVNQEENQVVNLYPQMTYQTFEGFGGAITDAAGYVYSLMDEEQKRKVIQTYFSPKQMR